MSSETPDGVSKSIETFFSAYKLRKYQKGQVLLLNGEEPAYVYHLLRGEVKQYDVTYRGEEVIINTFKPPAFFPMSLAMNGGSSKYIYEAETNIEIRQAPVADALNFMQKNPEVVFDLLSRVYRGMDGMMGRMVQLMSGSAHSRLIYELVLEGKRFGKLENDGRCVLKLSEKSLGALTGLSRETVSREMHKLKSNGFVVLDKGQIHIANLQKLEKMLGQDPAD